MQAVSQYSNTQRATPAMGGRGARGGAAQCLLPKASLAAARAAHTGLGPHRTPSAAPSLAQVPGRDTWVHARPATLRTCGGD